MSISIAEFSPVIIAPSVLPLDLLEHLELCLLLLLLAFLAEAKAYEATGITLKIKYSFAIDDMQCS